MKFSDIQSASNHRPGKQHCPQADRSGMRRKPHEQAREEASERLSSVVSVPASCFAYLPGLL